MSTDGNPALVVYDLDGVIVRGDSFAVLLLQRAARSPISALRALPMLLRWALARSAETRAARSRAVTAVVLRGMTADEYARLAARVGRRIGADPRRLRLRLIDRIRSQRAAGVRVVIATASEEQLVSALLERAGVRVDLLSASSLGFGADGPRFADHRIGARKAEALLEAGIPIAEAEFLTDSVSDLPTARLARTVRLVGASSRTAARFVAAGVEANPA